MLLHVFHPQIFTAAHQELWICCKLRRPNLLYCAAHNWLWLSIKNPAARNCIV